MKFIFIHYMRNRPSISFMALICDGRGNNQSFMLWMLWHIGLSDNILFCFRDSQRGYQQQQRQHWIANEMLREWKSQQNNLIKENSCFPRIILMFFSFLILIFHFLSYFPVFHDFLYNTFWKIVWGWWTLFLIIPSFLPYALSFAKDAGERLNF